MDKPMGSCPHPGCDIPMRGVYDPTNGHLTVYHGEDRVGAVDVAAFLDPATGGVKRDLGRTLGQALAEGVARFHRSQEATDVMG